MGNTQVKGSNYAWAILIACIAFYAIPIGLIGNNSGLFVTPVMNEFGWTRTDATLYMSIQPWVAALVTPFAGKIIAKYNARWILTITAAAYGLSSLACAWFTEAWMWDVYGVIYGVCAAFFMYIAVPTLVNRWFRKHNGLAIGICGAGISILAAIMSPVIQTWISAYGWQTARIIISVASTVLAVIVTAVLLRPSPESMGVLPYGYDEEVEKASADKKAEDPSVKSGATLAQARKSPALYMLMLVAGFLVMGASFVQQLSSYCSTSDLGAAVGAIAVSICMVGGIIGKFLLGWVCDKFGSRVAGILAGLLGSIGVATAFFAGANVSVFYVGVALFGVGYSALSTVPPMLCSQGFGQKDFTQIYSWVTTFLNICAGCAALIYAQIYDLTGSFNGAFWFVIFMYLIVTFFSFFIVPVARKAWSR
jgi:MFS family permease